MNDSAVRKEHLELVSPPLIEKLRRDLEIDPIVDRPACEAEEELAPKDVAAELNKSLRTIQRFLLKGVLKGRKIEGLKGPEWRVTRSDLEEFKTLLLKIRPDAGLVKELEEKIAELETRLQLICRELKEVNEKNKHLECALDTQIECNEELSLQISSQDARSKDGKTNRWWHKLITNKQ
jgi:hypothetical protein